VTSPSQGERRGQEQSLLGWVGLWIAMPVVLALPLWFVLSGFFQQSIDPEQTPGLDWVAAGVGAWVAVVVVFGLVLGLLLAGLVVAWLLRRRADRQARDHFEQLTGAVELPDDAWRTDDGGTS